MNEQQRKAMELALEALETHVPYVYKDRGYAPITAIREALEQPEQEPVAHCEGGAEFCPVCRAETHSLAQPEQEPSELLLRGILASELKCWHRLTADEAQNLVHFVQKMGSKQAQPEQPKIRTGDCLLVGVCASEGHKIALQRTWVGLIHGVRVEGDTVLISTKNNDVARELCGSLIEEMNK